jgi:molybdopterin-binding protein
MIAILSAHGSRFAIAVLMGYSRRNRGRIRLGSPDMPNYRVREAADLLGVSDDSLRRWADSGRVSTTTDAAGRLVIDGAELARFAEENAAPVPAVGAIGRESARNRFVGLVTRVLRDTVMAQVEMQCGPYRVVSLMSREAADELGLEPGVTAVASVKSTNVVVEVSEAPS